MLNSTIDQDEGVTQIREKIRLIRKDMESVDHPIFPAVARPILIFWRDALNDLINDVG